MLCGDIRSVLPALSPHAFGLGKPNVNVEELGQMAKEGTVHRGRRIAEKVGLAPK